MDFKNITVTSARTALLSGLSIATLVLLTACGGGGGTSGSGGSGGSGGGSGGSGGSSGVSAGVVGLSQHDSSNSHTDSRRGQDCMDCHTSGPGTGVFITSGTATGTTGRYVEYFADSARTDLRASLEIDANGNFYTVTAIDILTPNGSGFSQGAYVSIRDGGSRRNMPGVISHLSASCNECHSGPGSRSPL